MPPAQVSTSFAAERPSFVAHRSAAQSKPSARIGLLKGAGLSWSLPKPPSAALSSHCLCAATLGGTGVLSLQEFDALPVCDKPIRQRAPGMLATFQNIVRQVSVRCTTQGTQTLASSSAHPCRPNRCPLPAFWQAVCLHTCGCVCGCVCVYMRVCSAGGFKISMARPRLSSPHVSPHSTPLLPHVRPAPISARQQGTRQPHSHAGSARSCRRGRAHNHSLRGVSARARARAATGRSRTHHDQHHSSKLRPGSTRQCRQQWQGCRGRGRGHDNITGAEE